MMPVPPSLPHGFRLLAALICLSLVLGGCGYSDEMHQRQTWRKLLWYEKYDELDQALSLDPKLWQPFGLQLMSLSPQWGGSDGAMVDFIDDMERRGIDRKILDQLQARRLFQLGLNAQYGTRDHAEARQIYEQALTYIADTNVLKNLAELHAAQGDHAKAVSLLEKDLAENDESDLYSIEALARSYFAEGRDKDGKRMPRRRDGE